MNKTIRHMFSLLYNAVRSESNTKLPQFGKQFGANPYYIPNRKKKIFAKHIKR